MPANALEYIRKAFLNTNPLTCLLAAAVVLSIDYITGRAVQFPITYVIPIWMAAWGEQKRTAYVLSVLLPSARVAFHFLWQEEKTLSLAVLNASIAIVALVIYSYLIERTARQTRALEKKVKILEGILPVCAACKRIRNKNGQYEQIEHYITDHSEASFSHGICPDCAKKLYPEFYKETKP